MELSFGSYDFLPKFVRHDLFLANSIPARQGYLSKDAVERSSSNGGHLSEFYQIFDGNLMFSGPVFRLSKSYSIQAIDSATIF